MARRLGPALACLLGCGDGQTPPPDDLVGQLSVEHVASLASDKVLAVALAALDDRALVVARATTQGADFCAQCLGPEPTDCGATCRRAVLEVAHQRTDGTPGLAYRFRQVFPRSADHDVGALDAVVLDDAHVGVAWLECDRAPCGAARPKQSCTARYTTVELHTGRTGPIATLYEGWYGDLQLAFDPRTRELLALVGTQAASSAGVRAAIYDASGATQLAPWRAYGGAAARAPAATASAAGFVIAADDPAPGVPGPTEPCAASCDCATAGVSELPTGGLYAFWPGTDRPAERISPGRTAEGTYGAREAIAAIEAGGRVIVASSQGVDGLAELFEPAASGWLQRHSSQAPVPLWLGALGDAAHLAWIGSEVDGGSPAAQRLVAGVVLVGQLERRGELLPLDPGPVLGVAPVTADGAVTAAFLLHGVSADGSGDGAVRRFEVLAIRADW